jgi:uncharacterized protein involved in exopolysaccharide biosynthesis
MDERLDLRRLADFVWGYRRGLVLLALAVAAACLVASLAGRDSYQAGAQVLVLSPVAQSETEPHYELTMQSYLELARGEELLRQAVQAAGQQLGEESRRPGAVQLDVLPVHDTRLLVLKAEAPSASDAASVANEAARQFVRLCQDIRAQEILDKRRLIGLDLEALEKRITEESRRLDELLAGTGQWTREEIRDEIARLQRLQTDETLGSGLGPSAAAAPAGEAAGRVEARLTELRDRLEKERASFEAIELQRLKLEQLQQAYAALLQDSQTLGNTVNQRLGSAVVTSEAEPPRRAVGLSAASMAVLGGAVALMLSIAILVLWALLTGEHLGGSGGAPGA